MHRVVRRPEGGDGARGVRGIPRRDTRCLRGKGLGIGALAPLLQTAAGSRLGRGVEVHLDGRVGKHRRADIAAIEYE
jgi:hypothetical protein